MKLVVERHRPQKSMLLQIFCSDSNRKQVLSQCKLRGTTSYFGIDMCFSELVSLDLLID